MNSQNAAVTNKAFAGDGGVSAPVSAGPSPTRNGLPGTITVIVPTYNCGRFIAESIQSILAQTLQPEEIIVVDDGSTDDTEQVVGTFTDPRIRYIRQQNAGVSVARNTGLSAARGEYIAFLDADDRWRPTFLEKLHGVVSHDSKLVCAFANFIRFEQDTGKVMPRDQFKLYPHLRHLPAKPGPINGSHVLQGDAFCALVAGGEIPSFTQAMMFRSRLIDRLRFNPTLRICQDMEWVLQTFMRGPVAFITEPLTEVRRHDTNATRNYQVMALHKLNALRALEPHVVTPAHQTAYRDRLVKAHIDAAFNQSQRGELGPALKTFSESFRVKGSPLRKVKGAARITLGAFTSLFAR
ncbi:glycosyltransferase family 2 protein [Steroidobacter sp.]|uniref:glycosyltransferase family 2 protein n=1 Tax=Steroidobacter sp. TaxID=1978227 RepID=UPI001A5E9698|nr:glycosyltransferase family 2 protein [Steroidobacter sp.]MBL8266076.1 glycosyltransferase family 2 protein [Steroidobacter sp.]